MVRWRIKSCPRCGGDLFMDRDMDSWYEQCLQCSYRVELQPVARFKGSASAAQTCSEKRTGNEASQS